jgi:hypothetical protein
VRKLGVVIGAGIALATVAFGAAIYVKRNAQPTFPATPFPPISASKDPAVIREGAYLVNAVAHCTNCHVPHRLIHNTAPEVTSRLIPSGGGEWDLGPVGVLHSPNLTADRDTGIGSWSDAEIARAIRYGINREGHALIYMIGVGPMDDRDLRAIVSYLRTLAPVNARFPEGIGVAGKKALRAQMPALVQPKPQFPITYVPRGGISVARGAYLANGPAMCFSCHSNVSLSPTLAIDGPRFAGSQQPYPDPDHPSMEINAPNLTPSRRYGQLRGFTEDQFVARIRAGRVIQNSDMPWENFRLMSDEDLMSIYRYLNSLAPVERDVGPTYRPLAWKPETAMN